MSISLQRDTQLLHTFEARPLDHLDVSDTLPQGGSHLDAPGKTSGGLTEMIEWFTLKLMRTLRDNQ